MLSYLKLTMWAVFWLVLWVIFAIVRKNRDNCLTWAQRQHDEKGGYLVIRWCRTSKYRWLKWPHFLWLEEKYHHHLKHYIPKENAHTQKTFPHPWFYGKIIEGDNEDHEN